MARLDKLDDVLFPVDEHPVFVSIAAPKGDRQLPVPDKKAIVDRNSLRVLGIVGRSYRLVSNHEALALARECCRTVFPETNASEWEAHATDAPATASYCHIDLWHKSSRLDFNFIPPEQRPDVFGPFIRVTNSYNGLRALAFDIGFHRKICSNGLIIPDTIIRFRFTHNRRGIRDGIRFDVARKLLAEYTDSFTKLLGGLRSCTVKRGDFEPLLRGVMHVRTPERMKPDSPLAEEWETLNAFLGKMCDRYKTELGENAYAVFNAMTEFASAPPANRCVHRDRHSLQRLAGSWLTSFTTACSDPGFRLDAYLTELAQNKPVQENTPPRWSASAVGELFGQS